MNRNLSGNFKSFSVRPERVEELREVFQQTVKVRNELRTLNPSIHSGQAPEP
jgi:hypothetical protein